MKFQLEGKRDEFRKYLEASGATATLTTSLMKLYQEPDRPENATEFIRRQMGRDDPTETEEYRILKEELEKMKAEKEKFAIELEVANSQVKKTASEVDTALQTKFQALAEDESGTSLLKEYLTEEMFEKLRDLKTKLGGTLLDNIQSGLANFDSEIGIFASDPTAYDTFRILFDPVLQDFHDAEGETEGEDPKPVTQPELDWGDSQELDDLDPEGLFIQSISITVGRALTGVKFMPTITLDELKAAGEKIRNTLTAITDEDFVGKYTELVDMGEEQKKQLIEEGILFPEPDDKFLKAAETYRFWPLGRAFYLNEKNNFRVWVNEEEHLQITSYDINGNLKKVYDRLVKAMKFFSDLEFARNKRWGFVAHNLKNVGNTMRVTVKAKLPQLSLPDNTDKLDTIADGNHITVKDLGSGLMELTSNKRVGVKEIDTVKEFKTAVKDIITAEKCLYVVP